MTIVFDVPCLHFRQLLAQALISFSQEAVGGRAGQEVHLSPPPASKKFIHRNQGGERLYEGPILHRPAADSPL